MSGIVLAPLDEAALVAPVADAARAGIPVVIFDSGLKGSDYVSFVATDNREGGHLAGERLATLLHGTGKVVLLRYAEGSDSTAQREDGFLEAIAAHPGIQVVSSNQYGGADVEGAYKKSESMLARFKNADGSSASTASSARTNRRRSRCCACSKTTAGRARCGSSASTRRTPSTPGLATAHIDGLVLQDPVKMGYLGVKTIVAHIHGQPVEQRIDTGVTLATHDHMDDPAIKELLHPDLSQWLNQ